MDKDLFIQQAAVFTSIENENNRILTIYGPQSHNNAMEMKLYPKDHSYKRQRYYEVLPFNLNKSVLTSTISRHILY